MSVYFGDEPCLYAEQLRRECELHSLPVVPWLDRANSFTCRLGPEPGQAWILLTHASLVRLNLETSHDLVYRDGQRTVTHKSLVFVRAFAATPGYRGDPAAAFWCDIRDKRYLASARPIDAAYNVKNVPGSDYLSATKNGGSAWTWATMTESLWNTVGTSFLGTFPGLPFTPHGTPENYSFYGGNAYQALNLVLDRLGCALEYQPLLGTFAIVRLAVTDATATTALNQWDTVRTWDAYPNESNRSRVPEKVRIHFLKQRQTADSTGGSPYYTLDRTDPTTGGALAGVQSGTYALLFDDLVALYNSSGTLTNSSTLASRADERASDFFRRARLGMLDRTYSGHLDEAGLLPGAQIHETSWRELGDGFRTRVRRAGDGSAFPPGLLGGFDALDMAGGVSIQNNLTVNQQSFWNSFWMQSLQFQSWLGLFIHNYLNLYFLGTGTTGTELNWVKVTKTHADYNAAAPTETITVYTMPAKTVLHGAVLKHTQLWSGGALTNYAFSLSYDGTTVISSPGLDGATAPSDTNFVVSEEPPGLPVFYLESFAAGLLVEMQAAATGGNVADATQGSIDVYLLIGTLP